VPDDAAYFHAQFHRVNPMPFKQDYTIVDNIKGKGQYVGTYMAYGSKRNGWWGEGEIKFFMDGDAKFPTIMAPAQKIISVALMILIPGKQVLQALKQQTIQNFQMPIPVASGY
jgi:hypothetical protein